MRPKADGLKGVVEPAGGDAVVGLMGGHVMDAVVLAGQDDVPVLQNGDVTRQAKVGMGPLVALLNTGTTHSDLWSRESSAPVGRAKLYMPKVIITNLTYTVQFDASHFLTVLYIVIQYIQFHTCMDKQEHSC